MNKNIENKTECKLKKIPCSVTMHKDVLVFKSQVKWHQHPENPICLSLVFDIKYTYLLIKNFVVSISRKGFLENLQTNFNPIT